MAAPCVCEWTTQAREPPLMPPAAKRPTFEDNLEFDPVYAKLAESAKDKEGDAWTNVRWVCNHVLIPLKKIDKEGVPSAGAVSMLAWARSSPLALQEFMRSVYAKVIPARTQIENLQRFSDDGRQNLDLISRALDGFGSGAGNGRGGSQEG